jgi:hypothetical protein
MGQIMDFITETTSPVVSPMWMIITLSVLTICVIGIAIVAPLYAKRKTVLLQGIALVFLVIGIVSVISSCGTVPYYISHNKLATQTVYDNDKFSAWVLNEYRVEINDKQSEALLYNAVNTKNPTITDAVYIETFDGEDATAILFHNEDDWRLIIHDNIAISTPNK